jgi:uncharacterized membrane protein
VLLWLHIVVAMITLGPLVLFDMVVPGTVRSGNAAAVRWLSRRVHMLGPVSIVVALLGVALVLHDGDDPYSFSKGWISGALTVYILMSVNSGAVLDRTLARAADRLEAGQDAGAEAARLRLFGALEIVGLLVILWLMVAKPGQ